VAAVTARRGVWLVICWRLPHQLYFMADTSSLLMNYLELFFGTFEQYSWIGSATNIVHLEDTIIDSTVADLASQLSMQIPLMKVSILPH
jgi:hypothetical protein